MTDFIRKNLFVIIFTAAGAAGGFLYWRYVGCLSGTCMIKSVWYMSTLYGMAVGWIGGSLLNDLFLKFKKAGKNE
ncbi:MAG TPA: hypothetical protein PKL65_14195 [Bacteroidales bacterium]|nr:hypothetical protein [Bacteroidales bacterium]HNR43377.1 hypothetical protein [Bacteroidales bacterium]HPM18423.1 hypothetical protein [Bacteroidales bacterium]HQG77353.1 hypothetical protein [Bacteroidales bacterium]